MGMRHVSRAPPSRFVPDVDDDSYRPQIEGSIVAFILENLGSCNRQTLRRLWLHKASNKQNGMPIVTYALCLYCSELRYVCIYVYSWVLPR